MHLSYLRCTIHHQPICECFVLHLQVVGLHSAVYRFGICDRLCYKGAKERENLQGGELFGGHHWQRFLPAFSSCMASVSFLRVNNKLRFLSRPCLRKREKRIKGKRHVRKGEKALAYREKGTELPDSGARPQ